MRVFVTGAAGFVGSRLSRTLLDRGDTVLGFDNFDPYYERRHKDRHLLDLLQDPRFELVEGDLRSSEAVDRSLLGFQPDAVAHLAGMAAVRYSVEHPLVYSDVNVQGSIHVLDAARRCAGAPSVVMASTGSVYGSDTEAPFSEESPAIRPLAPYPASKRAMELFAYTYSHLWGVPTTVLRFFNVYGPHGRPDMMPWKWAQQISAGEPLTLFDAGRLKRDWTYIDDIVRGFIAALDARLTGEVMNIGCGNPVENLRFVEVLEQLLDKQARVIDVPAPPSEPKITFADITRAGKRLGYRPQVQVEEGLSRFVAWMREVGELPS